MTPSLRSSAGLVGADLCVNIAALNIREEGGRKSQLGGRPADVWSMAKQGHSRVAASGEARRLQG